MDQAIPSAASSFSNQPFLKWAGGKRWLVNNYVRFLPVSFNHYFEPFLGSGAVFFALKPKLATISDCNKELIDCFNYIKLEPAKVELYLSNFHAEHSKELYYQVRAKKFECPIEKAAAFIYLNRVCWNGLYRVNKRGEFNVPIGTKTSVIRSFDNLQKTSILLQNANIHAADFEEIIDRAKKNDFIFADPPYTVKHDNNGFVKYNENIFSWNDQIRLRNSVEKARRKGVKVALTNANHASVRELYANFGVITEVHRASVISGKNTGRSNAVKLLISSYM